MYSFAYFRFGRDKRMLQCYGMEMYNLCKKQTNIAHNRNSKNLCCNQFLLSLALINERFDNRYTFLENPALYFNENPFS